jgi:hypothetical protein
VDTQLLLGGCKWIGYSWISIFIQSINITGWESIVKWRKDKLEPKLFGKPGEPGMATLSAPNNLAGSSGFLSRARGKKGDIESLEIPSTTVEGRNVKSVAKARVESLSHR